MTKLSKESEELGEIIASILDNKQSLADLVMKLKSVSANSISSVLNDKDLTDLLVRFKNNKASEDELKTYIEELKNSVNYNFADKEPELFNFSGSVEGEVKEIEPKEQDIPGNILYSSGDTTITKTENFGYIIKKTANKFSVESYKASNCNFTEWKYLNRQLITKDMLASIIH